MSNNSPKSYIRPRSDLAVEWLDNELLILDRHHEKIHQLNATASYIWTCLVEGLNKTGIIDEMSDACGVTRESICSDVDKTLQSFSDLQLIEIIDGKSNKQKGNY